MNDRDQIITDIAEDALGIETLETRNMDGLDFYNVPVWGVKEALERAYEAGRRAE